MERKPTSMPRRDQQNSLTLGNRISHLCYLLRDLHMPGCELTPVWCNLIRAHVRISLTMCLPEFCAYATAPPPPLHRLPDLLTQSRCGSARQASVVDSPSLSTPGRGSGSPSAAGTSRTTPPSDPPHTLLQWIEFCCNRRPVGSELSPAVLQLTG